VVLASIEGLQSVRGNLTNNFVRAVEAIASNAHVYLTGVGKSGIIATKIAATSEHRHTRDIPTPARRFPVTSVLSAKTTSSSQSARAVKRANDFLSDLKKSGTTIIPSHRTQPQWPHSPTSFSTCDHREACPLNSPHNQYHRGTGRVTPSPSHS
jgi:hypothetical protein